MSGLEIIPRGPKGIFYAVGTVGKERVRTSLGTSDRERAEEEKALLEARLWKRHTYGEEAVRLFEEAAVSYMKQGGEARFLAPILKHFKGRKVGTIKPGEIRSMALTVYPNALPATRNRQGIVPARAVVMHAHDLGWCGPITVKLFEESKSKKHKPVDRTWLDAFLKQADADKLWHVSAIVLFMNQTAARVAEAVRLMGQDVDLGERTAVLNKTKTEEGSMRYLTAELAMRLSMLDMAEDQPVFSYTDARSVNRRIKAVCRRAGIVYRTTHSAGRHSFGTNAMADGGDIKQAMDAGGWKSAKLFLETYVHSDKAGRSVADKFDRQNGLVGANLAQPKERKGYRFGKKQ